MTRPDQQPAAGGRAVQPGLLPMRVAGLDEVPDLLATPNPRVLKVAISPVDR